MIILLIIIHSAYYMPYATPESTPGLCNTMIYYNII